MHRNRYFNRSDDTRTSIIYSNFLLWFTVGYLGIPNEITQIWVFISGLVAKACSHICFVSSDSLFCFLFWHRVTKTVRGPLRDRQIYSTNRTFISQAQITEHNYFV